MEQLVPMKCPPHVRGAKEQGGRAARTLNQFQYQHMHFVLGRGLPDCLQYVSAGMKPLVFVSAGWRRKKSS